MNPTRIEPTKDTPAGYSVATETLEDGFVLCHFVTPESSWTCSLQDLPAFHLELLASRDELRREIIAGLQERDQLREELEQLRQGVRILAD